MVQHAGIPQPQSAIQGLHPVAGRLLLLEEGSWGQEQVAEEIVIKLSLGRRSKKKNRRRLLVISTRQIITQLAEYAYNLIRMSKY